MAAAVEVHAATNGINGTSPPGKEDDYSNDFMELTKVAEELRRVVSRIQMKLAADRHMIASERAALDAHRVAAAADRELVGRMVSAIESMSGPQARAAASSSSSSSPRKAQPKEMPGMAAGRSSETEKVCKAADVPPMPTRTPPPASGQRDVAASVGNEDPPCTQSCSSATQLQGGSCTSSATSPSSSAPSPGRLVEPPKPRLAEEQSEPISKPKAGPRYKEPPAVKKRQGPLGAAPVPSAQLPVCSQAAPVVKEAPPCPHPAVASVAIAPSPKPAAVPKKESSSGRFIRPGSNSLDEDEEVDEVVWAEQFDGPPAMPPLAESPHYRHMPPPPQAEMLTSTIPLPPAEAHSAAAQNAAGEGRGGGSDSTNGAAPTKAMPPKIRAQAAAMAAANAASAAAAGHEVEGGDEGSKPSQESTAPQLGSSVSVPPSAASSSSSAAAPEGGRGRGQGVPRYKAPPKNIQDGRLYAATPWLDAAEPSGQTEGT